MKRKGEHKVEQVPKKKKPEEEEESSSSEEEEEVQTNGKKAGKVAQKAAKKEEKPIKKAEQAKKTDKKEEKKKPSKQEGKKKVSKKESSDEEDEEEEAEEESKPVKSKAKPAAKAPEKKGGKKAAKKDSDEEEEEEEEETVKSKKADKGKAKAKAKASKKDDSDEEEEEEEEEKEEKKPEAKKEEETGFVVKSAANGGMKIKGAPPPPVNLENLQTSTIFIKNLPWSVTDEMMRALFADCGPIKEIRWISDKDTGKFKGYGFLDFETPEAAKKAMSKDGADCGGRPIKLDISTPKTGGAARPSRPKIQGSRTVFIGKCPDTIEDDDIRQLFESCGTIASVRWVNDKATGKFKGCGFVVFEDTNSTDKAVALNGTTVKGSSLRIDFADD